VQRAIETIDRNARVQTQLIEDILDVSRIISGKLNLEVAPVDLASVIHAAVDSVRPAAAAKEITIEENLAPGVAVSGDVDRLQQVFWNLVANAAKFTPHGGRVQVRLVRAAGQAEASVTDDGVGIEPEFLPHVFERFRQADSSSTRSHRGLGLGLAIVRHLTELHGGTVGAASPGQGRGSTFTVSLPLVADTVRQVPARRDGAADAPLTLQGIRVVVVDDEVDTREVIEAALSSFGAEVVAVGSASEAMAVLGRERTDVLLADIEMPHMDGYALVRWLRTQPASLGGGTPAAALTAYARPEDQRRALEAGFQAHLSKPVRPEEVARTVRQLAAGRAAVTR
jgi:CheY-like chemotaxis protein/two-component sensor histidine kinase